MHACAIMLRSVALAQRCYAADLGHDLCGTAEAPPKALGDPGEACYRLLHAVRIHAAKNLAKHCFSTSPIPWLCLLKKVPILQHHL